jgi:hypothetical protein
MQAPANDDGIITFLFSTNADSIRLIGDFGDGVNSGTFSSFTFEREALDENGNMNVEALKNNEGQLEIFVHLEVEGITFFAHSRRST